jgi:hypothetical protein
MPLDPATIQSLARQLYEARKTAHAAAPLLAASTRA